MSIPVWPDHGNIEKIHLIYLAIGGFLTIYSYSSRFIKERLYLSEAIIAAAFGILIGPVSTRIIDPQLLQVNINIFTLEFARIVVGFQCFVAGIHVPSQFLKQYVKSILMLLGPVMVFMWIASTLIIKFMLAIDWLDALIIAGCVTPTDPVLANSIISGTFAEKHVPIRIRRLLSTESGLNDGLGLLFVQLPFYLKSYASVGESIGYWILNVLLYQIICSIFLAILFGTLFRKSWKLAHKKQWIDKESFLSITFTAALFIVGLFARLGMDEILAAFVCGSITSWDSWLEEQLESKDVQQVMDHLLNMTFFVFFGTRLQWVELGLLPVPLWKIIVCSFLLLLRRLPAILALNVSIPAIKNWKEAFFVDTMDLLEPVRFIMLLLQ